MNALDLFNPFKKRSDLAPACVSNFNTHILLLIHDSLRTRDFFCSSSIRLSLDSGPLHRLFPLPQLSSLKSQAICYYFGLFLSLFRSWVWKKGCYWSGPLQRPLSFCIWIFAPLKKNENMGKKHHWRWWRSAVRCTWVLNRDKISPPRHLNWASVSSSEKWD